jgi:thioredoxin-related protein
MKSFLMALVALSGSSNIWAEAPGPSIQWIEEDYDRALETAKQQNKLLFILDTTVWCGPCKKLKAEVFSDPNFIKATASEYVFFKTEMVGETLKDMTEAHKRLSPFYGTQGWPSVILVNSREEPVQISSGYKLKDKFLKKIARDRSPKLEALYQKLAVETLPVVRADLEKQRIELFHGMGLSEKTGFIQKEKARLDEEFPGSEIFKSYTEAEILNKFNELPGPEVKAFYKTYIEGKVFERPNRMYRTYLEGIHYWRESFDWLPQGELRKKSGPEGESARRRSISLFKALEHYRNTDYVPEEKIDEYLRDAKSFLDGDLSR